MKQDEKEKRNHTGQQPSDKPSEKLINPPDPDRPKKMNRKSNRNTTAKDPNLGNRDPILR
jgi:hypothetical protein